VGRRRGGYCFEHNLLFAALLERAGFEVTRLSGRARLGASFVRPRTHMALLVRTDAGDRWLADVGFGGGGLLEPIPLAHEATTRQGAWTYRVVREEGGWGWSGSWGVQALHPDGWFDLYGFTVEPQHPMDYVMANHYTSTHPLSAFTRVPTAQQAAPDRLVTLRGRRLTEALPDGTASDEEVDAAGLDGVLRERFGIELTAEELDALRDRW
jgi:N-hydroxyarylamine O-acetyltransferase